MDIGDIDSLFKVTSYGVNGIKKLICKITGHEWIAYNTERIAEIEKSQPLDLEQYLQDPLIRECFSCNYIEIYLPQCISGNEGKWISIDELKAFAEINNQE